MYSSQSIPANDSSERLEIYLNGRGLKDLDVFSKSDPYVKVFFKRSANDSSMPQIGRTETILNDLNPNFTRTFVVDYIFEQRQNIRFEVWDQDQNGDDDFIGSVETTLGALAGAKNQTSILQLSNPSKAKQDMGKLIARCDKSDDGNLFALMKMKAMKLMNTDSFFDFWDKSDPYLKFMRIRSDNTFVCVKQTQVIDNSLNPSWRSFEVPLFRLVTEKQRQFRIECWDHDENPAKHTFIGEVTLNADELTSTLNQMPKSWPLRNPKHKNPGTLVLQSMQLIQKPTFVDYLKGGLQLNLITAIDFTGSNGSPSSPSSLHYMNPIQPNQYQIALRTVGQILLNYDYDKRIPAFGFGGKPKFPNFHSTTVNHCFPLTGNLDVVQANGLVELQQMYAHCLKNVQLAGPTYFGPLIGEAIKLARICKNQGSAVYQILLILTDGEIHDMDLTVDQIVDNTDVPLSIIIVGLGNADFTNMNRLDGDNGLFNSRGKKAMRDIVQFVSFREIGNSPFLLAKELLAQVPTQVVQYMSLIGKPPGSSVPATQVNMKYPE